MKLYQALEERRKELECIQHQLTERMNHNSAEGTLRISHRRGNGGAIYYHMAEQQSGQAKKNGQYIRKNDIELARTLAQKEYDLKALKMVREYLKEIEHFEKIYDPNGIMGLMERYNPERRALITPIELSDDEYAQHWQSLPYKGKAFLPNETEIYTEKGERVRSKSEKIIADKLTIMGIPYKYECPINLQGFGTVYPDFTILHIKERRECYLEHLGMMDAPQYAEKAVRKIGEYARNGICQGQNLILTFETSDTPLDVRALEKMLADWTK